jgi:CheY-like chemotaxis protein
MVQMRIPAPVAGCAREDGSAAVRPDSTSESSRGETSGVLASGRRILVVDDVRDSADTLANILQLLGHQVRAAYDGLAALAIADEWRPDVIIADIAMPGMHGYELARRLRAGLLGRDVLLIALTGFADDEHRRRSKEAGFDHHFVKPVSLDTLVASATGSPTGPPIG